MDEIMKALDDKPTHSQPKSPEADVVTLTSDIEPLIHGGKGNNQLEGIWVLGG